MTPAPSAVVEPGRSAIPVSSTTARARRPQATRRPGRRPASTQSTSTATASGTSSHTGPIGWSLTPAPSTRGPPSAAAATAATASHTVGSAKRTSVASVSRRVASLRSMRSTIHCVACVLSMPKKAPPESLARSRTSTVSGRSRDSNVNSG